MWIFIRWFDGLIKLIDLVIVQGFSSCYIPYMDGKRQSLTSSNDVKAIERLLVPLIVARQKRVFLCELTKTLRSLWFVMLKTIYQTYDVRKVKPLARILPILYQYQQKASDSNAFVRSVDLLEILLCFNFYFLLKF